jgi:hypothetical protein
LELERPVHTGDCDLGAASLVSDTYLAMGWCHYRSNYLYGLLVKESSIFIGPPPIEDLLGYTQNELDIGRAP